MGMTNASDVHLFAWMKENWEILVTFLAVFWAMVVFWMRTVADKFYTRAEINARIDEKIDHCKVIVDKQDQTIIDEVEKVATSIKEMRAEQQLDAKHNRDTHEQLIHDVGLLHGKMDS